MAIRASVSVRCAASVLLLRAADTVRLQGARRGSDLGAAGGVAGGSSAVQEEVVREEPAARGVGGERMRMRSRRALYRRTDLFVGVGSMGHQRERGGRVAGGAAAASARGRGCAAAPHVNLARSLSCSTPQTNVRASAGRAKQRRARKTPPAARRRRRARRRRGSPTANGRAALVRADRPLAANRTRARPPRPPALHRPCPRARDPGSCQALQATRSRSCAARWRGWRASSRA